MTILYTVRNKDREMIYQGWHRYTAMQLGNYEYTSHIPDAAKTVPQISNYQAVVDYHRVVNEELACLRSR